MVWPFARPHELNQRDEGVLSARAKLALPGSFNLRADFLCQAFAGAAPSEDQDDKETAIKSSKGDGQRGMKTKER